MVVNFDRDQFTKLEIPERWRNRVKGFLFLPYSFDHISNNKLAICDIGTHSFDSWLAQHQHEIEYGQIGARRAGGIVSHYEQKKLFVE